MQQRICQIGFIGSLIILLVALISGCKSKTSELRTTNETINIQKAKPVDGVDLYLLIDESGSMSGSSGTDRDGLRFDAGRYLIQNLLVKKSDPQNPNRIAVIHFGDNAISNGLKDLTFGGAKELAEAVTRSNNGTMGNTNFKAALEEVVKIDSAAPEYKNVRNKIIVIFTDGEPDDSRHLVPVQKYFDEIQQFYKDKMNGFSLYVIGIDNLTSRIKFSETLPEWKKIAGVNNVNDLREVRDLYTKFNQAIQQIFELPQVERITVAKEEEFEVQPYLDKVEFHIFTDSNVKLGIKRPDGKLVTTGDADVSQKTIDKYSILTINNPKPGKWKYEILAGNGSVNILRNPIPFRLQLIYPTSVYPVGKSMMIRAEFNKENGEEVKELPDYPLSFTAKITSPDYANFDEDIQFVAKNKINKTYYANIPVKMEKPGVYNIKLKVKGGTRFETSNTQKIFVQSFPYIDFTIPQTLKTYPLSDAFNIDAKIKRGLENADPKKEYQDNPNDLVLVQIISSPDQKTSPAVWLNYNGSGKFGTVLPFKIKEGNYTLAVKIKGEARIADKIIPNEQIEVIDFFVSPTGGQITQSVAKIVGAIVLAFLLLWTFWIILWLSVFSKKFSGYVTVIAAGQEYISGFQEFKWIKPILVDLSNQAGEEDTEKKDRKKLSFWVKSKGEDAICVYSGGLFSVFSMGIFSEKTTVCKDEVYGELGDNIQITIKSN